MRIANLTHHFNNLTSLMFVDLYQYGLVIANIPIS